MIDNLLDDQISIGVRDLLEDFRVIPGIGCLVLIPRRDPKDRFLNNIKAAVLASSLELKSIDYVMKEYVHKSDEKPDSTEDIDLKFTEAYLAAKGYMHKVKLQMVTNEERPPSIGVFSAVLALERLQTSFFAARLLYRLGNEYEAHAVSRLILEQIAWAYSACQLKDPKDIQKIVTTKTISQLREIFPEAGKLYGYLSSKTHIDFSNHREFLGRVNGRNTVILTANNLYDYARVILTLADVFVIVWEYSQFDYMRKIESIKMEDGDLIIKEDRKFLKLIKKHLEQIKKCR